MEVLDRHLALRLLREALEERGADYVYVDPGGRKASDGAECVNVFRGEDGEYHPSCIVGHVVVRAGVSADLIAAMAMTGSPAYTLLATLKHGDYLDVTDEAVTLLSFAQRLQDKGATWGETVAGATDVAFALGDAKCYGNELENFDDQDNDDDA